MSWIIHNDRPIYLQLIDQIKHRILSGVYPCGSRFPSVRELAAEAAVNPNTMQRALATLEQERLLIGSRSNGRTVTTDETLIRALRETEAKKHFMTFVKSLSNLGYTETEIATFINEQRDFNNPGMEEL